MKEPNCESVLEWVKTERGMEESCWYWHYIENLKEASKWGQLFTFALRICHTKLNLPFQVAFNKVFPWNKKPQRRGYVL